MFQWASRRLKEIYSDSSEQNHSSDASFVRSVHALVNLVEAKDPYTKRHSVKVSSYAVKLAKRLNLSKKEIEIIRLAAILHDIGKLGIQQKILLKNGSLTRDEFNEVKKHPVMGIRIVRPIRFLTKAIPIIKHHHENFDGTGYPDRLKGLQIPLGSRIIAIADSYDALTSKRAYRDKYSSEKAISIMKRANGKKFDPNLFKLFMEYIQKKEGK